MGWNNDRMTRPVGMGDISTATGISSGDIGTLITQAGANGLINKFAKYKPVRLNLPGEITDANRASVNWGFGSSFTDGIPSYDSKNGFHSGFMNIWNYYYPRGASYGEWFRMLDFEGYTKKGNWTMSKWVDPSGNINVWGPFEAYVTCASTIGDGMRISFGIEPNYGQSAGLLTLADFANLPGFFNLSTWHFGLALISKTSVNNDMYYILSGNCASSIETEAVVTSSIPNDTANGYYIVPILAEGVSGFAYDTWTSNFPGRVLSFDGWYGEIKKSSAATGFRFSVGTAYVSNGNVYVDVDFYNYTGNSVTTTTIFTYAMTDESSMDFYNGAYSEMVSACQYWLSNHQEKTGGQGYKFTGEYKGQQYTNAPVVLYAAQPNVTIPSMYSSQAAERRTFQVASGTADGVGNPFDTYADIRLCMLYNGTYVCNNAN